MESLHGNQFTEEGTQRSDIKANQNPKQISKLEQQNFREYAEVRLKKMFEYGQTLYRNVCTEFQINGKIRDMQFPNIEFRPSYALLDNGSIDEAIIAAYYYNEIKSQSIPKNSIIVYLPAYELFLKMASAQTEPLRKQKEKGLDVKIGHELGHEVLDNLFNVVLSKDRSKYQFNPDYNTDKGRRLHESLAELIGMYQAHGINGESTGSEAIAKSLISRLNRDGLKLEDYYKFNVLSNINNLTAQEVADEKSKCDATQAYAVEYLFPYLGITEALAASSEMPLSLFIKEAFVNPNSFSIGIPEYILDKNKILLAFTGRYFFKSDLQNKATILEQIGRDIASEANYVYTKLTKIR
jgi:hypothetical protein